MRYSTVSTLALALALTTTPAAFAQNASQGQQPAATTGDLRPAQQQVNPADPYSDDADAGAVTQPQAQSGTPAEELPAQAQSDDADEQPAQAQSDDTDEMQPAQAQSDDAEEMQPAQAQTDAEDTEMQADQTDIEEPADQQMAADESPAGDPLANADEDMRRVIDKLAELGAKPIETLSVEEARAQPTFADAVKAVMSDTGASSAAMEAVATEDMMIPGAEGEIPARIYTPASVSADTPAPVIVYFHGGGWVIAGIDVYDASARALAEKTGAIVVSASYRQAPEHPFPASHEDAVAAYKWVVENSGSFNGDANRIAVAGESAGGGLAAHVAIQAREQQLIEPVHQLLVYPIAGTDMTTPSYQEMANAKPLSKAGMEWFFDKVFTDQAELEDPRVDLIGEAEVEDLPPATIINAEIDPLRSDGEMYAEKLESAGVDVEQQTYQGVTHEFFGAAAVIADAEEAQNLAADRLKAAFGMDPATTSAVPADDAAMEGEEPAMQEEQPADMEEEPAEQ